MEKRITRINGVEISAVEKNGEVYLPVKPICEAIGVDAKAQRDKIKEDDFLSPVGVIITSTGADGKNYEMFCLPLQYVYGWLATINPGKVAPEAKENVIRYRRECYDVLYRHFTGAMKRTIEINREEIRLLDELNQSIVDEKEARERKARLKKKIDEVRASRLDPQPSLFD